MINSPGLIEDLQNIEFTGLYTSITFVWILMILFATYGIYLGIYSHVRDYRRMKDEKEAFEAEKKAN